MTPDSSPDWRATGDVTEVRDQGRCGSCWAFSALGAVEAARLINFDIDEDLSEQELVNCVYTFFKPRSSPSGCRGGWMYDVYNYML